MKTDLLTLSPADFCNTTRACKEGGDFAKKYKTMAEVWDACPRPDWLCWLCNELDLPADEKATRLFMVWCARHTPLPDGRTTGDSLTDPRSLRALEVAERFAHGQATEEELTAASDAARAAASDVAWTAAWAAARDAAWTAASAVAWDAARDAQARKFREFVPNPFRTP